MELYPKGMSTADALISRYHRAQLAKVKKSCHLCGEKSTWMAPINGLGPERVFCMPCWFEIEDCIKRIQREGE